MGKRTRASGEGSISRRKDGSWMARYTLQTPTGPKRRAIYAKRRKEAAQKLAEAIADRDKALVFEAGSLTVSEYLERWLEDSVQGSVKVTTYHSYGSVVRRHVAPTLGRTKLRNLTPAQVQELYRSKLNAGLSPKTVKYIHTTLHRALKQAFRWGLVPHNVSEAVDPTRPRTPEMRPRSPAEARKLLEAAKGDRLETLYILAVTTGLRQGELLGLRWEDVDLEARTLRVRRTLTIARGGPRFTEPKTRGSRRQVTLTSGAVQALRHHRERQQTERLKVGEAWLDQGLVFTTHCGNPLRRCTLHSLYWKPLLRRGGLPDVRFHDLRHTCATLLLSKGIHPKLVQELLGHSTVAMTLDTYSHVIPGLGNAAANAMKDVLFQEPQW